MLKKIERYQVIREYLLAAEPIERKAGDVLQRSLIRHDSEKLAKVISRFPLVV